MHGQRLFDGLVPADGAGQLPQRFALPNASILVHQPLGGFSGGQVSDFLLHAEESRRVKSRMTRKSMPGTAAVPSPRSSRPPRPRPLHDRRSKPATRTDRPRDFDPQRSGDSAQRPCPAPLSPRETTRTADACRSCPSAPLCGIIADAAMEARARSAAQSAAEQSRQLDELSEPSCPGRRAGSIGAQALERPAALERADRCSKRSPAIFYA